MAPRKKKSTREVMSIIENKLKLDDRGTLISFNEFLTKTSDEPFLMLRNIFQLFNNMIYHYIKEEEDDYQDDPESISYKTINCDRLLVDDTDTPFFADLPLANRIVKLADSFKEGAQQNKIYIFIGPPGSGKSTFLTNLLRKFQEYTHKPEGMLYETIWRIDQEKFSNLHIPEIKSAIERFYNIQTPELIEHRERFLEVQCPNHDHPILAIPKELRREVLENLLPGEAKIKIFNKKEYDWIFKNESCTICSTIFEAILSRLKSPTEVFKMIYAKRYWFDRRIGRGISVYNPGDHESQNNIYKNEMIQKELSLTFHDSNIVKYMHSKYSGTNNGVYVLMDVKGENERRFLDLHGIISEGTYKINEIEENINSLFIGVMNPEDKTRIIKNESFKDRITEINVNYTLNYTEEVKIYYNAFGSQIRTRFLPGVLNNFAKIIISSRLNTSSPTFREWIKTPSKYKKYCDENLLLLKLSIYNNKIPSYLSDEDYKNFSRKIRKSLIDESEYEGRTGFSGRESINIFNEFYNDIRKKLLESTDKKSMLINMEHVKQFFEKSPDYTKKIPQGFIESIIRLYNYNVLQQIKKSLFQQNEEKISNDIQNYLFALSYEVGETVTCPYTGDVVEITDNFLNIIESHLLEKGRTSNAAHITFRKEIAKRFTISLQDMYNEGVAITETDLYKELHNNYLKTLRENILQPFLKFTSFENAIKEYGQKKFEVYDTKTKEQVKHLLNNLQNNYQYTLEGAKQVCIYVLSNNIAEDKEE